MYIFCVLSSPHQVDVAASGLLVCVLLLLAVCQFFIRNFTIEVCCS